VNIAAEHLAIALGQIVALSGFVFWLSKRNLDKIDKVAVDVAVIKNEIKFVRQDHDNLILYASRTDKLQKDIDCAHEKIRKAM